jgi:alpha-beta hydrolase superfamily lysophospholipase
MMLSVYASSFASASIGARLSQTRPWALTCILLFLVLCLGLSGCAPLRQGPLSLSQPVTPGFGGGWFTSFDGARLGLDVYLPRARAAGGLGPCDSGEGADPAPGAAACKASAAVYAVEPDVVIIAVHGMNDYAGAFRSAASWWSTQGAAVYAYDQRGFGRSPGWMIWPQHELMRRDLSTAVSLARARHPAARIAVLGESMGGAVAITAFADSVPPDADVLILSAPGLRGWQTLPWLYGASLWMSSHVRPDWIVVPPKGVRVTATDNNAKLREMWFNPLVQKSNRIDSVYGVVSIMEEADQKIVDLPERVPTLMLYGARDEVILPDGVRRAAEKMPDHVRTAYYEKGYHMLLNDLQAETVWSDVLAFIRSPAAPLPSGAPGLPWGPQTAGRPASNL